MPILAISPSDGNGSKTSMNGTTVDPYTDFFFFSGLGGYIHASSRTGKEALMILANKDFRYSFTN